MAALETDAISSAAIGTEQTAGAYTVPAGITRVSCRVYLELLVSSAQTLTLRVTNTPSGESEATEIIYSTPKSAAANTTHILSSNAIDVEEGDVLTAYVTSSVADTVDGHCKWFDRSSASGTVDANIVQISGDSTAADNLELDYDGTGYAKANSTIGTCTANTDMRGTDNAALAAKLLAYVQLLARSDAGLSIDLATEFNEINADEGSGAGGYSNAGSSQQATVTHGDSAWATATSVTVSDKTGFALTSAYDAAKTAATQTSVNAIATILTGITSLGNWLRGLFRKDAMDATAKTEINTGGGAFDETTDSNEAIRDRGDSAYLTATGFAVPGDEMDIVNAPNATAITAIQSGITPLNATETAQAILDATAASYDTAGSIGEKINAAGSSADPLLNAVPGSYADGTAGKALGNIPGIKTKTDQITGASITITNPVSSDNNISLVSGDDYNSTNGSNGPLIWTIENYTGVDLSGATATFRVMIGDAYDQKGGAAAVLELTPTISDAGSGTRDVTLTLEMTAANTASLTRATPPSNAPSYFYSIVITDTSKVSTPITGRITVVDSIEASA